MVVNKQHGYGTPVPPVHRVSQHAHDQMDARSISADALRSALKYGRMAWTRGARIYAIGRKEVQYYRAHGVNLGRFEGVHVVEKRRWHDRHRVPQPRPARSSARQAATLRRPRRFRFLDMPRMTARAMRGRQWRSAAAPPAARTTRVAGRLAAAHARSFCSKIPGINVASTAQPFVRSFMGWQHTGAAQLHRVATPEALPDNLVEPLTRCNLQGVQYRREASVDAQIKEALALGTADLVARARILDKADPAYLQEESLAYLIRRAHRAANDNLASDLLEVLVQRCTRYLKTLRRLPQDKFEEVVAETVAEIVEKLVEPEGSDAGDFLQVKFWVVVKRLGWAAHKRAVDELKRESLFVTLEPAGADSDDEGDRAVQIADRVTPPVDTQLLNDEALSVLEPHLREAFVLKVEGWPIEDRDPNVMTISNHFGKTSRTIRNWITEAETQLAAWRDEKARS